MSNSNPVYSTKFIIYLVISIVLIVTALILIKKYVKSEKAIKWIIKGTGIALFIIIVINRVATAYMMIVTEAGQHPTLTWWFLLPETFCGMTALLLSIDAIFFKANNKALHSLVYFGFVGGLIASVYPTYLSFLDFFSLRAFTGLLHHSMMVFLIILMFITKHFVPSIKQWYVPPITYAAYIVYGLFAIQVLGFPKDTMSIFESLITSLPVLTSWYMMGILGWIGILVFEILYEHFYNKKKFKTIFIEMKPGQNKVQ